jgi:tetratricopeptide (TPR) repeat protein
MRRALCSTVLVVLGLGVLVPALGAQLESDATPYVSPPAWKSVEIGNFYLRRKKYRAALSRFKEAVKTDPYYAEGYLGLGEVYDRLGLKQNALKNYQKYLDLLPSTKQAEEAKKVHEAIERLESQLKRKGGAHRAEPPDGKENSKLK